MKLLLKAVSSGSNRMKSSVAVTKWAIRGDGVTKSFSTIPSGTKEKAFKRIVNEKGPELRNIRRLEVTIPLSQKEATVLKGLSKKGGFSDKWHEVVDLDYNELIAELFTHFALEILTEGLKE